jgi:DNA-binding NarL/FixJ family response regulator
MYAEQTAAIKLLIADDQRLFSENLKLMLETLSTDIRVTGIAANGREALEMAEAQRPDLVLMDVSMPELDGVEAARLLNQKHPEIKIVMLTTFPDDTYVRDALHYGAHGYILKNIQPEDLLASIRAIARGASFFSSAVLEKVFQNGRPEDDPEYRQIMDRLSKREREIISLVAKGYSNKKIADTIFISEPTVRNYISSIYAKVGTKNRFQVMSMVQKGRVENG